MQTIKVRSKTVIFILLSFTLAWIVLTRVIKTYKVDTNMSSKLTLHNLSLSESTRQLTIVRGTTPVFEARLASSLSGFREASVGVKSFQEGGNCLKVVWTNIAELSIRKVDVSDLDCYTIEWTPLCPNFIPVDEIHLAGSHWYGGGQIYEQKWPSSEQSVKMRQYVTEDFFSNDGGWGNILEPFWISSKGAGLFVDQDVPLHASLNENGNKKMELKADYNMSKYKNTGNTYPVLRYDICIAKDIKHLCRSMFKRYFDTPDSVPDARMFSSPIWSTWAKYKVGVDEKKVLEYAEEILKYRFTNSQLEIDDMYTSSYGEMDFDTKKFPNAKAMMNKLHSMGFRVTSWTHPFVNKDSPVYKEGTEKGYFVLDGEGKAPAQIDWWQGTGAVVDVTNKDACDWYAKRLERFQKEFGMDSFKFDAGETNWLPDKFTTTVPLRNPSQFTNKYVDLVSRFGGLIEVRSAYATHKYPVFLRMLDKHSTWGYDNGLKSMIPTALVMGIVGYPFILPDMIGGNGYPVENLSDGLKGTILPTKELFIRWTQLSAYLPSMQFSICPWQYDDETIEICRQAVTDHETKVTPVVLDLAWNAVKTGEPIIRPLWWLDCEDDACFTIDSEFLIGDNLLVAPILEEGGRSRDVYLPKGKWEDQLRHNTLNGKQWLKDYRIELDEIATFKKIA